MEAYNLKNDRVDITQHRLFFIVLFLSVMGILFFGKKAVLEVRVLDENTLMLLNLQKGDLKYFGYILRNRGLIIPLLFLLSTTYLGRYAGYATICWYGFSIGTLIGVAMIQYGLWGIFFLLMASFPQYLLYVPVLWLTLKLTKTQRVVNKKFVWQLIVVEAIVIVGCWLESTVNLVMLEKIIALFVER